MLSRQILLRLRRGHAVQPVPAAGRADAGHGHAVRLGRAHGVAHAHGELSCHTHRPRQGHQYSSENYFSFYLFLGVIRRQLYCSYLSPRVATRPLLVQLFLLSKTWYCIFSLGSRCQCAHV